MSYPYRLRPIGSIGDSSTLHVELDTAKQGRLDEIKSAMRDLEEKASALSVEVVEEVLELANGYDDRIVGIRVERHLHDDDSSTMEVQFLRSDEVVLRFDDYRPGTTPEQGPSGGVIPQGLYGLYSVLVSLGYTFYGVHEEDCECVLELRLDAA